MRKDVLTLAVLACLLVSTESFAQQSTNNRQKRNIQEQVTQNSAEQGEAAVLQQPAWFGTLESAREEAARTERPILLFAARPECRGVPGVW